MLNGLVELWKGDIDSFNDLIATGNVGAIKLAVQDSISVRNKAMKERCIQVNHLNFEWCIRSQQELVAAMSDPRYDEDPAYRQDVIEKLDRSDNVKF